MRYFGTRTGLTVESKGHFDPVTEADREVERFVVGRLSSLFPDDAIVGEEGTNSSGKSGRHWVIDPIDGTFNFLRGMDQWSVSIGLFCDDAPMLGVVNLPARQRLISGGRDHTPRHNGQPISPIGPMDPSRAVAALGLGPPSTTHNGSALVRAVEDSGIAFRYLGCGSVSLLSVALGEVDGYISLGESSWDVMASLAILRPLGVQDNVDWRSTGLQQKFSLACGTGPFMEIATDVLRKAKDGVAA